MNEDLDRIQNPVHNPKTEFERVAALLRAGDLPNAEQRCLEALRQFPGDGQLLCLLGATFIRSGRAREAEDLMQLLVEEFPDFGKGHEELANAVLAQSRPQDAIASLQRVVELEPKNGLAHYKLAKAFTAVGRAEDAQEMAVAAARLAPVQIALAQIAELRSTREFSAAEEICRTALTNEPDNAELMNSLGVLAMEQGHFPDAVVLFRRAVTLVPDRVMTWLDLARSLAETQKFEDAIDAAHKAATLAPDSVMPYLLLGKLHTRAAQYQSAIDVFNAAIAIQPSNAMCLSGLAYAQKTIGLRDEAVRTYRDLIHMYPDFVDAYWGLANLKNVPFAADEISAMEQQLADEGLPAESQIRLCFALGKACEDESEYERAFDFFQRGNSMRRMHEHYDTLDIQSLHDRIIGTFDKPMLDAAAMPDTAAPVPIFIVGLPRSGSTLLEQILASHSLVEGTHELPDIERLTTRISRLAQGASYPEAVQRLSSAQLRDLGQHYLDSTQRFRSDKPYFVDKMPNNFRSIGLIRLILPQAKVIDARRHPLDSCLGSYKQLFVKGQPFSYDLFELGEYYLEYRRLMAHWQETLSDYVLDVHYEDVVSDAEGQIQRLLQHCGLEWEDACLNFHQTERAVNTASSEQVRQPIYATSVNNWRHYEKRLGELIEILRPILNELPAEQRPSSMIQAAVPD